MGMIDFLCVSPITPKLQNRLLQLMALSLGYKSKVKYYTDTTQCVTRLCRMSSGYFKLNVK